MKVLVHAPLALTSLAFCVSALVAPASAQVVTTGAVEYVTTPPTSLLLNAYESQTKIRVFQERTGLQFPGTVTLRTPFPQTYSDPNSVNSTMTVPAFTTLNSYMIHYDTINLPANHLEGTITFPEDIVGLAVFQSDLEVSDPLFALPGVPYANNQGGAGYDNERDVELGIGSLLDQFTLDVDRRTIRLKLITDNHMDELRVLTAPAGADIDWYCFAESGCPCGNDGGVGARWGCLHSSATLLGGVLRHVGVNTVAPGALRMVAVSLPPNSLAILYMGQSTANTPFGDGIRCVAPAPAAGPSGPGMLRYPVAQTGAQGSFVQDVIDPAQPQAMPGSQLTVGSTWYFQVCYRNSNPSFCTPATFNTTNAMRVTFR